MVAVMEVSDRKITQEELQELFGERMPIEAAVILQSAQSAREAREQLIRLSPPAPEVDEATMWTRKVMDANWSYWGSNAEMRSEIIRQAIAELIASKDAEIATEKSRADHMQATSIKNAQERNAAERELTALRAENERLRNFCTLEQCEEAAERKAAEPAAEIEAACDKMAARMGAKFEKNERWPEVAAATDTAPVVEVTQAIWSHVKSFAFEDGRPLADLFVSGNDKVNFCNHISSLRTEAEARGRREALDAIERLIRAERAGKEPPHDR